MHTWYPWSEEYLLQCINSVGLLRIQSCFPEPNVRYAGGLARH
eukprot:SAG31_NODE_22283_length_529_cov_1.188372_1_plen_42_part_01